MDIVFLQFKYIILFMFLYLGFAINCSQNCKICQSQTVCTTCLPLHTLFPNATCSSCQCYAPNCLYCNCPNSYACSVCNQGYTQNNNNGCNKNLDLKYIIGSMIGGTIGIILIVWLYNNYFRKCQIKFQVFPKPNQNNPLAEIDQKNKNKRVFTELDYDYDKTKDHCIVCLESDCTAITSCHHYFHVQCLNKWLQRNRNCPHCKNNSMEFVLLMICLICQKKVVKLNMSEVFYIKEVMEIKCKQNHELILLSSEDLIVRQQ